MNVEFFSFGVALGATPKLKNSTKGVRYAPFNLQNFDSGSAPIPDMGQTGDGGGQWAKRPG
jgi:hypothetical protein